jgi:hypothetical protein
MGFPGHPSSRVAAKNDVNTVAALLKQRHKGFFMVWNLSGISYDASLFDEQVRRGGFGGQHCAHTGRMNRLLCVSLSLSLSLSLVSVTAWASL